MQGIILQGIGGFYYALDESGEVHQVRAQRKLRRDRKPKVGDRVEITPGEGEEDGWILGILPRRNELVRPPVANIDVVVIVAAAAAPLPDLSMVDRLMINARRSHIEVMLALAIRALHGTRGQRRCRRRLRLGSACRRRPIGGRSRGWTRSRTT